MNLIKKGFFREMPHAYADDPSVSESVGNLEYITEKDKICEYLDNGIVLAACCGTVDDIINPNNGVAGCPDLLTDGNFVWPGDYSYYIKNYNVSVDEDFFSFMQDNNWKINFDSEQIDFESITIDGEKAFS